MNIKQLILILLCSFILPRTLSAQSLPESWMGKWEGTVEIWSNNQMVDSFPMSLTITPTDTDWDYVIDYQRDPERPDVRRYSLFSLNDSIGHFAVDEHNGIILDTYRNGNCLNSAFSGMNTHLLMRLCLEEDGMAYEITSMPSEAQRINEEHVLEGDTIPEIRAYSVINIMRANLVKAEE
ncbi:MAG: hypothetical protein AAFO91_07845 [Bacteroidota bacterium]